jgi:beta-xylosidase
MAFLFFQKTIFTPLYGLNLEQWDSGLRKWVMTFSALSNNNEAIWGSQIGGVYDEEQN